MILKDSDIYDSLMRGKFLGPFLEIMVTECSQFA